MREGEAYTTSRFPLSAIALRSEVDELHVPPSIGTYHIKSRPVQKRDHQGENEILTMNRATLGISAAHVMTPLVESGARFKVKRLQAGGVFGALVVVTPGVFDGSDVVIQDDNEKVTWQSSGRDYGISYGFFHNACVFGVGTL